MQVRQVLEQLETARQSINQATAWLLQYPLTITTVVEQSACVASSPIRLITENGFEILRLSESDRSIRDSVRECGFAVTVPGCIESVVKVGFTQEVIAIAQSRRLAVALLSENSSFWLYCAECHLAAYLWEMNRCPPSGFLCVDQLSPDDLRAAASWK